jgi:hypothetical protein
MSASCSLLRFTVIKKAGFGATKGKHQPKIRRIEARTADQGKKDPPVGALTVYWSYGGPDDGWAPRVTHVLVSASQQRCGVGTKLYEEAAKLACKEFKVPLQSDAERSGAADAFWQKQIKKGRARCLQKTEKRYADDLTPVIGRSGCYRYVLTCPVPATLSRPRSK